MTWRRVLAPVVALSGVALFLVAQNPMSLQEIRARHAGVSLTGKNAVVVGGTAGIGMGIAMRLAQADASVTIVGRSRERGEEIVKEMSKLSKTAKHSFVMSDASLISNAVNFSQDFAKTNDKLDYLVLTQGIATIQGRTETPEGIDVKLSLHYFSRVAFINKLLPLLRHSSDARVLTVLSAGVHSPFEGYKTDPDLKTTYSLSNAANAAGLYNDLATDALARANPGIAFVHAAPGVVNTNWGTEMPWYLRWLIRAIQPFTRSTADCGEAMACALMDDDYRGGWGLMGSNGQHVRATALQDAARDAVWQHTEDVLRPLGAA